MPMTIKAFKETKTKADLQRKMKESIEKADGKVRFVAAKDYKIAGAPTAVFMVVDKVQEFLVEIKKQEGIKFGEGDATVVKDDKGKVKVTITTIRGGLPSYTASTLVKLAAGNDPDITGAIPDSSPGPESQGVVTNSKVAKMVQDSHDQARAEGKIDYKIEFTTELVTNMAKASLQSSEFGKFNQNFTAFLRKHKLDKIDGDAGKLPMKMWGKMLQAMIKSGYVAEKIPKATDGTSFVLAFTGPAGEPIREKMLEDAMAGLQPFVDHAGLYLDKIIDRAESGTTYAFWSGRGAEDSAKASSGVSLEGTVGSFFAKWEGEWIKLPQLTGVADLQLWAAMSEMYAKKAAESVSKFKFIGFLGPTATRDQSVFNKIEQPTFLEVLKARQQAQPSITWNVVDCAFSPAPNGNDKFKGAQGFWNWTKAAPKEFNTRESALAEVIARYEM